MSDAKDRIFSQLDLYPLKVRGYKYSFIRGWESASSSNNLLRQKAQLKIFNDEIEFYVCAYANVLEDGIYGIENMEIRGINDSYTLDLSIGLDLLATITKTKDFITLINSFNVSCCIDDSLEAIFKKAEERINNLKIVERLGNEK